MVVTRDMKHSMEREENSVRRHDAHMERILYGGGHQGDVKEIGGEDMETWVGGDQNINIQVPDSKAASDIAGHLTGTKQQAPSASMPAHQEPPRMNWIQRNAVPVCCAAMGLGGLGVGYGMGQGFGTSPEKQKVTYEQPWLEVETIPPPSVSEGEE